MKSISAIPFTVLFCMIGASIFSFSCGIEEEPKERQFYLPYPDEKFGAYLQVRVDSSEYLWFADAKGIASAFFNDQLGPDIKVTVGDVVLLGEGLFHAQVEVQLPSKLYILTLERPYKDRGKNSIWQIVKLEEKEWPKPRSESAR